MQTPEPAPTPSPAPETAPKAAEPPAKSRLQTAMEAATLAAFGAALPAFIMGLTAPEPVTAEPSQQPGQTQPAPAAKQPEFPHWLAIVEKIVCILFPIVLTFGAFALFASFGGTGWLWLALILIIVLAIFVKPKPPTFA